MYQKRKTDEPADVWLRAGRAREGVSAERPLPSRPSLGVEYFVPPLLFGGRGGPVGSANGFRDTGGGREAGMAETGMVMRVRGKAIGETGVG